MHDEDEDDPGAVAPVPTANLAREEDPPAELEERVVAALAERGLLVARPASWFRLAPILRTAATLVLGVGIGLGLARPERRDDRFVLLLQASPALGAAAEAARVQEYGAWARELRARGIPIRGEKLGDEVRTLGGPPGPASGGVSGYFVLGVADPAVALAVAESCPHLRHGGSIEVRRIESR